MVSHKEGDILKGNPALDRIIGVVSFGGAFCDPLAPFVHTRVAYFSEWIQDVIIREETNDGLGKDEQRVVVASDSLKRSGGVPPAVLVGITVGGLIVVLLAIFVVYNLLSTIRRNRIIEASRKQSPLKVSHQAIVRAGHSAKVFLWIRCSLDKQEAHLVKQAAMRTAQF